MIFTLITRKLNGITILNCLVLLVVLVLNSNCHKDNGESFDIYGFMNESYLPLLDHDTFPRNISDRILDIKYWEPDTIVVEGVGFENIGNHMVDYYDYSFKWNFASLINCRKIDSVLINKCPPNNLESFKTTFNKGYVVISKPKVSGNFLLIKEYRRKSNLSESYDNEYSYFLFEKMNNKWQLKTKKHIIVKY